FNLSPLVLTTARAIVVGRHSHFRHPGFAYEGPYSMQCVAGPRGLLAVGGGIRGGHPRLGIVLLLTLHSIALGVLSQGIGLRGVGGPPLYSYWCSQRPASFA
ncbi:hypothetical protein BJX62DRAFT_194024, partial [Aspergillus germanicus]